jgi:phosphate starvation-inducible protein PhoH and related proteins
MSEATIPFADLDQIRTLFGTGDEHLRRVRDSLGIDIVIRGDELKLQGSEDQVRRGREIIEELRGIIERQGYLLNTEVGHVLGEGPGNGSPPDDAASVELFHKARKVEPRSPGQSDYVRAIRDNDMVFCAGPAGCGKTYLAVAMAVNALRTERVRKIVLVRPAVEAGEKLGFLPGDIFAKVNPYLRPLLDALNDILDYETVKRYMEKDVIEIVPLAFMRGRTLNQTFIILDEGQNTTITQMKMFLTRMGDDSKIVVTGDVTQIDLPGHVPSGLTDAMERLSGIDNVGRVVLTGQDIVRHPLVREVVRAYEATEKGRRSKRR